MTIFVTRKVKKIRIVLTLFIYVILRCIGKKKETKTPDLQSHHVSCLFVMFGECLFVCLYVLSIWGLAI